MARLRVHRRERKLPEDQVAVTVTNLPPPPEVDVAALPKVTVNGR